MRLKTNYFFVFLFLCTGLLFSQENKTDNTWQKVNIDFNTELKSKYPDGRWSTTDGYSDNVHRSKTSSIIIRTGISSTNHGLNPGFYTNTSVEWDLATDTVKIIDVAPWGGGSYGDGQLLDGYKENIAPAPRHTYDSICYDPQKDELWLNLGANWRIGGGKSPSEEAKTELAKDYDRTWCYSFSTQKWSVVEDSVKKFYNKVYPYESHLTYWPAKNKLLFFDSNGGSYLHFDLEKKTWEQAEVKNKAPMNPIYGALYGARSAWDSKRGLWIFRIGPQVCTFNPETATFEKLPDCYDLKVPTKKEREEMEANKIEQDKRMTYKGVCYNSKHDLYMVSGPTGNDTVYYDPEKKTWTPLKAGDIELKNGYMQYDEKLDIVILSYQLDCYKLKFNPAEKK